MPEPEKPKPKSYSSLHDQKIDDVLKDYQKLFHPDSQEEFKKERGYVRNAMRNRILMHLAQHGVDEKTKMLKRYSYHDMKGTDKRKWAEDFLHTLALGGIDMHLGKDAAKGHAGNLDELRDYIERHMATESLGNYEAIVNKIAESKNLRDDFEEDQQLKELLETYVQKINSSTRKNRDYTLHLNRFDHAPDIAKYANGIAKKHGLAFAAQTPVGEYLKVIQAAANPDYKPKKGKYIIDAPKEKK